MIKIFILYLYYIIFFEFSLCFKLITRWFIFSRKIDLLNKKISREKIEDFNKNGFCKFLLDNKFIQIFNLWNRRFKFYNQSKK
jgi:hypothetical protein